MHNDDLLRKLVEANAKRTPGEWAVAYPKGVGDLVFCDKGEILCKHGRVRENAAFIVACTRAMPAIVEMLAENERLRAELAECKKDAHVRIAELKSALSAGVDVMESARIFVTSRERIKRPEGELWYDETVLAMREALTPMSHQFDAMQKEHTNG